jgi:DNA-binding response OmpR family regulator
MPDADGYDVLENLKKTRFATIPVVFLTVQQDRDSIVRGINMGAVDFIFKPNATENELVSCIEYHLEKKNDIKPTVLVIDDDPSILTSINALIKDLYIVYTVPGAANEKVVRELLKKVDPDIFLLDCHMPGLSGFDLVPIIRSTPLHDDTPIIFITSDGTPDNVYVAISKRMSDFIVKPIDRDTLRSKLATHLRYFMAWRRMRSVKK